MITAGSFNSTKQQRVAHVSEAYNVLFDLGHGLLNANTNSCLESAPGQFKDFSESFVGF
jgi:hypothetical protein